jgi:glycosyltransferase involved in cell wall biosynthesis
MTREQSGREESTSPAMSPPLVTIGCAVYNGEATLRRALAAVVGQDYSNLEILLTDDCSTDGSRQIYEEFASTDPRIKIHRNPKNVGITETFNRLIREATGKYFMLADQDDIRDTSFVRKAVAALEADEDAVLCHSHTGVFMGDPNDVKYLITLHGVDGVSSRVLRYYNFLKYFADTAVYGLFRSEVLKSTTLFRRDLGSANALLFESLLRGKFIQIPEVLYFYSARGVKNRPDIDAEYERCNPGKKRPLLYLPFLVLALNQTKDIRRSPVRWLEKLELGAVLWGHTSAVAVTKLIYRSLAVPFDLPDAFSNFCSDIVEPKAHFVFLNGADRDEELFPKFWYLKGGD